jgi:CubicO group peptidase (beta-lactamase class C family)
MMLRRTFLSLIACTLAPAHLFAQAHPGARIDSVFARWDLPASPGCALGVDNGDDAPTFRAYGMADLEHDVPNEPSTIFEAGSVSKQFTAAAVMLLALDGSITLDDDVRKYIPEVPQYDWPITIRHMLTHTSGLRDWGSVAALSGWRRGLRVHTHDHVLDIVSRQSALNFQPGHEYSYSNTGYNLLAILVDRVSGMPFAEFTRRRIFEPIGMKDTQWRDDYTRIVKRRAQAYAPRAGTFTIDMPFENVHGNGGLLTTVGDLLVWNESLETGALGGPRFLEMMHDVGVLNDGRNITYAAGLVVDEYRGIPEVSHTGSTAGYRAFLARYPEHDLSIALLCNVGNANPGALGHQVADVFLPLPVRVADPPESDRSREQSARFTPSADDLAAYAGAYHSDDAESTINVEVVGEMLVLRMRPAVRLPMRASERDVFEAPFGTVRFIRDAAGSIQGLSVGQERVYDMRYRRIQ